MESGKTVVIIQARMGSTRLPGKTMADIAGKPLLWHVIRRVEKCGKADMVVVATTTGPSDDRIAEFCREQGVEIYRGSSEDVLDRYYQAARKYSAKIVIRVTADCPLIDPEILERLIEAYASGKYDYVSTSHPHSYPLGLDAEIMSFSALEDAWRNAKWASEREHVTPYIWKREEMFRIGNVENDRDLSNLRWTVDYPKDLEVIRSIYKSLGKRAKMHDFTWREVLRIVESKEELRKNEGIHPEEGYCKSVREDRKVR